MIQGSAFHFIENALRNPQMIDAATALYENRLHDAEPLLKARLREMPFDVAAMRMLAELAGRIGRYQDAENLLRRALELSPEFLAARSNLAMVLHRQGRSAEALGELENIAVIDPDHTINSNLKAAALGRIGAYEDAVEIYKEVLANGAQHPKIWMSYGHVLKTIGRQQECIAAYRSAIAIAPGLGEAYWSLANLKTVRFSDQDITAMEAALRLNTITSDDQFHLHFALGKAYEDRKNAELSFMHYNTGNTQRLAIVGYDPQTTERKVKQVKGRYTDDFYAKRPGFGCKSDNPIFILGMPRAGSTLIEQILSSHTMIEGTMELPDIPALVQEANSAGGMDSMTAEQATAMGQAYIDRTRIQRKTDKPYFIDKLPNNWMHIGFIKLILPNARIIDARRHPLDCCFSNFKQHFARGQAFSYSLNDVGHYYTQYVNQMAHFDTVLPGQIHRIIHEQLIEDTEIQVRALLAFLNLPFEESCLRFYENDRAVQTASSQQVRRPINRDGVGQWRMFAPWLTPLHNALGSVLAAYPSAP